MHLYCLLLAAAPLQISPETELHCPQLQPLGLSKEHPEAEGWVGCFYIATSEMDSSLAGPSLVELFSDPWKWTCGATTQSVRGPEFQGALPSSPVNMLPQDTQPLPGDHLHKLTAEDTAAAATS